MLISVEPVLLLVEIYLDRIRVKGFVNFIMAYPAWVSLGRL